MIEPLIKDVVFTPAPPSAIADGLLGFVRITLNGALVLDSLAVRRTAAGRVVLVYPTRTGRRGLRHYIARPADDNARVAIERQVFDAIDMDRESAR